MAGAVHGDMFEVSQVSVFISFRMRLGDGGVWFVKGGYKLVEPNKWRAFLIEFPLTSAWFLSVKRKYGVRICAIVYSVNIFESSPEKVNYACFRQEIGTHKSC